MLEGQLKEKKEVGVIEHMAQGSGILAVELVGEVSPWESGEVSTQVTALTD